MSKKRKPVLVTDTHRGVYFGYLTSTKNDGQTVILERMRHAYYYTCPGVGNEGVYGLATKGPGKGSKIGPRVTATIHNVSKVVDCTDEAVARWESAQWE